MPTYSAPIDSFSAGRADMAMLPEMMQLGQLMDMRRGIERQDYALRALDREEQAAFAEADEFDAFSERMKGTAGMTPEARSTALRDDMVNNPAWLNNQRVKEAMGALQAGDDYVLGSATNRVKAKELAGDERDLDFEEKTREQRQKLALESTLQGLDKVKRERSAWQAADDAGDFANTELLGRFIGGSNLDGASQKGLVMLARNLSEDPANAGLMKGLAGFIGSLSRGKTMLPTYMSELEGSKEMSWLRKNNVNLDPSLPPDQFNAQLAAASALAAKEKNPAVTRELGKTLALAKSAHTMNNTIGTVSQRLADDLPRLLEMAQSKDPSQMGKLKDELAVIGMDAHTIGGMVDSEMERRSTSLQNQKDSVDLQKKVADLKNAMATLKGKALTEAKTKAQIEILKSLPSKNAQDMRKAVMMALVQSKDFDAEEFAEDPTKIQSTVDSILEVIQPNPASKGTNGVNLLDE
jgi:hypothetical protein